MTQLDFSIILPLTILIAWACALLLVDLFIPKERKGITAFLAALGLALTLGFTVTQIGREATSFNGMVTLDGFSTFTSALILVSGLLGIALAYGYLKRMGIERGEYYSLMLFSVTGMLLMTQAFDLIIVFLALELLSIPLYVLAAFARPNLQSEEAGLKYRGLEISDYMGLAKKYPALAAAMTIFMLSFIGFPPTLGMVGKFYLFSSAIEGGFVGLAVIGVLTSLVSAYYYLRVVVNMYMREGDPIIERDPWLDIATAVMAVATVALSFVPQWIFQLAGGAVLKLF